MKYLKPYPMFEYLMKLEGFNHKPLLGMAVRKNSVGVSISHPYHRISSPLRTFDREKDDIQKEIGELISHHSLSGLVLGWPTYRLQETSDTYLVREFAQKLKNMHNFADVHFTVWNENSMTKNAGLLLKDLPYADGEDKSDLDMLVASSIVQGYLDFLNCDKSRLKPWSLKLWSPDL